MRRSRRERWLIGLTLGVCLNTTVAFAARPWSSARCSRFLTETCVATLGQMLTPLAIVSLLSMSAEAGSICYDGSIRHSAAALSRIKKASIPAEEDDHRYGLHEAPSRYGFTPDEIERIPKNSGIIRCPRTQADLGGVGNSFIVGPAADSIMTNAHVVKKPDGKLVLRDMSTCYFATSAEPNKHYGLRFDDDHARFGSNDWPSNLSRDFALLRLSEPVKGANPFRLSTSAARIQSTDLIYMISHKMSKMPPDRVVLPGEPIVQQCPFLTYEDTPARDGRLLRTGCATELGNSGSMVVRRDPTDNQLEIIALHRSGGPEAFDGQPVNVKAGNSAGSIPIEGPLKRNLDSFLRTRQADSH